MDRQATPSAKTALLIIDVQKGFVGNADHPIARKAAALQKSYLKVGAPVIAMRFVNIEGSAHRRWFDYERFAQGSEEVELAFDAAPDTQVMDKHTYTGITPALLNRFEAGGITEVHLCGVDTDICVLKNAVDIFEDGRFRPLVLSEACDSHAGAEAHERGLATLRRFLGDRQVT